MTAVPRTTHLFVYPPPRGADGVEPTGPRQRPGSTNVPAGVTTSRLPADPAAAAAAVAAVVADLAVDVLVFWDDRLGSVPWPQVTRFGESLDDAWHPGPRLTGPGGDEPDLMRYVQPLWVYRPDPAVDRAGAVNPKLDFHASVVRAQAVRTLGGLDGGFATLAGVSRELGLRLIRRGGVCRQQPALVADAAVPIARAELLTLVDRYQLIGRGFNRKWQAYALARRLLDGHPIGPELRAWRAAAGRQQPVAPAAVGALHRDVAAIGLPERPTVSVVLPTFGRYRYLAEVLDDLRAQTIRPTQILIADGNLGNDRQSEVYDNYADLPLEVIWHAEGGTCASRNACLRRATGDFVWFVDDDSRLAADNLEAHLRVLAAYAADVSVGPAFTRSRPELHGEQREIACSFMDCGTTLCRSSILAEVGGFDMQFNQYLAGEDGEIGIRFVRAGGLMLNNPGAKRFHYLAPVGGARRSKNNVHRWTRWSRLPRPVQSVYYTARRHYESSAVVEAMWQACVFAGWRRREGVPATRSWRLKTLLGELVAAPVTAYRLRESVRIGRSMVAQGPEIPPLVRDDGRRAHLR